MINNKINDFISKYGDNLPPEAISELQEISSEHKYLKTIFDCSDWTISLVDHNGKYLKVNPKMETIMGNIIGSKVGDKSNDKMINSIINQMNQENLFLSTKIIESVINEKKQTFLIQVNRVDDKF